MDGDVFERIIALLQRVHRDGGCIFVAGNGGSAATASHWVNDLHKTSMVGDRPGIRALALTDNVPLLTAFANDEGYASVFRQQLRSHCRPADALVVISVSGRSQNLIEASRFARAHDLPVIALLGWDGGELATLASEAIVVPAPFGEYALVETMHMLLCDVLGQCLTGAGVSATRASAQPVTA